MARFTHFRKKYHEFLPQDIKVTPLKNNLWKIKFRGRILKGQFRYFGYDRIVGKHVYIKKRNILK